MSGSGKVHRTSKEFATFLSIASDFTHFAASAQLIGGFEYRRMIIRLVQNTATGDRPKSAEADFANSCSMPTACYELFGPFSSRVMRDLKPD
jgi:hypothetical protein